MQSVELRPAFAWDCESCGRENFARIVIGEMSEEDRQALVERHGIEDSEDGDFMQVPDEVTCRHCGESFRTVVDGQEIEWGEELEDE